MCLATIAYVYAACTVRVTIFGTAGKFQPACNFTKLHALTLAACSYALLTYKIKSFSNITFRSCSVLQNMNRMLMLLFLSFTIWCAW